MIRIARADVRRPMAGEPGIGEVVMRAFVLRRVGLIRHAQGGVEPVGPGRGGDTPRLNTLGPLSGNVQDHVDYVIEWLAWSVKNPATPPRVALVLRNITSISRSL